MKVKKKCLIFSVIFLSSCAVTDTIDLEKFGFPAPEKSDESSTGTKVAAGAAGCVVGGAAGYYLIKALDDKLKKDGAIYSDEEVKQTAVLVAGIGCVIGGKAALNIIKNMDARSKAAQEKAWQLALVQSETLTSSEPQAWSTETHEGTVQILEPETTSNGKQCATRKNYVKTSQGEEAEQFIAVCKNSDGVYEPQEA